MPEISSGNVDYYEGQNGINNKAADASYMSTVSYPTLTYDYTRYELTFFHTFNGKRVDYEARFVKETNNSGRLVITSSDPMYSINDEMLYAFSL